jgi:hypothetical protein
MTGRRALSVAVGLCVLGSALAWFAATRTWNEILTHRVAPLPPATQTQTGGEVLPGLPALAVVGLAGAGAVLATRGLVRRLVGVLLMLAGLGLAGGGLVGLGEADTAWPVLCAAAGLLVMAGGLYTVARGQYWPHMGTRYERSAPAARTEPWEALDRGEDPTLR